MNIVRLHESLPVLPDLRVRAVIDTAALIRNYRTLLGRVQAVSPATRAIAVVKADAYGHGIRPCAEALWQAGCRAFAVSCLEEAMALREILREREPADGESAILILGYAAPETAPLLADYAVTTALLSDAHAHALADCARRSGVTIRVHAALDTGMNRIGYPAHNDGEIAATTQALCDLCGHTTAAGGLILDGIFTHFARADEDYETEMHTPDSLTMTQYARYRGVLDGLIAAGLRPRVCHVCNSAAAIRFPSALPAGCLDAVRLGINLYGYGVDIPSDTAAPSALEPVMRLETVVSHTHDLLPGETVGYGGTYSAPTPRRLATLPIGYADGWMRAFAGASVTIHTPEGDFSAPMVGRVCMDQCMADITDLPDSVVPGTPVTLFGDSPASLHDLCLRANTIPYELLCLITARVPRVYKTPAIRKNT